MRAHRFFRGVWRFNALVILFAGVLAIGALTISAVYALRAIFREREVVAVVNTAEQGGIRETLALGRATQIRGHSGLLVAVESDQEYDQAYFSKSTAAARNYGFVSASELPRWLYPHNRFLVVDASQLPASEYSERDPPTAVVSFVVVQSDSDGDERLTPSDLSKLVFTKPDGTGSKVVLENLRHIVSQEMMGEQVLVLYKGPSGYGKAVISANDFSQVSHQSFELPKTGT
jgi:hypothetical protein